jgi:hypothetical protein
MTASSNSPGGIQEGEHSLTFFSFKSDFQSAVGLTVLTIPGEFDYIEEVWQLPTLISPPPTMKQFVGRLGKALGLLLTIVGGVVTAVLLLVIGLGQIGGWGLILLTLLLLIPLGIIPLAIGSVSLYVSARLAREAVRDRFHQMLRKDKGRISLLGFANATRLEPAAARQYLDTWARECDATFDVTDEGDIYYIFSNQQPKALPAGAAPFRLVERVMEKLLA